MKKSDINPPIMLKFLKLQHPASKVPKTFGQKAADLLTKIAGSWFSYRAYDSARHQNVESYQNLFYHEHQSLSHQIDILRAFVMMLGHNDKIVQFLKDAQDPQSQPDCQSSEVTPLLEEYSRINDFSAVYLLTPQGTCILSSEKSFIGKNYGFRPYFKNALKDLKN